MKRHLRQLLKQHKKCMVRRPQVLGHAPPFWFKRQVQEIRMAQMEKYRQRRPKSEPEVYYHKTWTIPVEDCSYYVSATSSSWR